MPFFPCIYFFIFFFLCFFVFFCYLFLFLLSFKPSLSIITTPSMPEATDSTPAAPVAPAPRKGTVQIIDGKKVIFDENGKP